MKASIQDNPIRDDIIIKDLNTGAVVTFKGIVRQEEGGRTLQFLHYESETDLALKEMEKIIQEALDLFKIKDAYAVHRIGDLKPGEVSLFVVVQSEHRDEGFKACIYIVDSIKSRVPIWKEDVYEDGDRKWH